MFVGGGVDERVSFRNVLERVIWEGSLVLGFLVGGWLVL